MCCHLCRLEVAPGDAHDETPMHRAAQLIAVTALDRVRSQVFPDTEGTGVFVFRVPASNLGPTQSQAVATTTFSFGVTDSPAKKPSPPTTNPSATNISSRNGATKNTPDAKALSLPIPSATNISSRNGATTTTPDAKPLSMPIALPSFKCPVFGATIGAFDFEWCDYCQQLVAARAHVAHQRSKLHIDSAYQDQMFMEAVRGYVDEEDLKILEVSSTDGVHLDPFIPGSKLDKVYNCGTCDTHFVPVEFKKQHEDSIRHRACLALTAAACRRLRRHLAAGARNDNPGAPANTPSVAGAPDAPARREKTMRDLLYAYRYPTTRIKNTPQSLKPHLPPKIYINRILARFERIGKGAAEPHYTMIVTDELVIIKTAVTMAVDWLRYLGVRAHGEGHMECCACGGIFKSIEGHLETDEHVKYVLAPLDDHGVRQIDSTDSMCLLCGDKIWSFDVDAHINEEQHIKNRAIALTRGNMCMETKGDLKLHLILKTGTIKIVSEDSTLEKQDSEVIHNGDGISGSQVTVNTENGGDHALPSDTTKPSEITE